MSPTNHRKARRPRADALASRLSAAQHRQLQAWLITDKLSYLSASQRLSDWWGIVTSVQSISKFWYAHCLCLEKRRAALQAFVEIEVPKISLDIQLTFRKGDVPIGSTVLNLPLNGAAPTLTPEGIPATGKPPRRNANSLTKK